jgi:hypothetical protein
MPFIGSAPSQTFQRTDGTRTGAETWQEAKTAAVKIRADAHDVHDEDLADGIEACWKRDGGNQPSADLPMNAKKFTGVANASARTHFAAAGQVADSVLMWAGTSSGNDTITASVSPAITAYAAGQTFRFKAGGTNTGAATININSVGAKSIKKGADGATDPAAGDITAGGVYIIVYDGTNFQLFVPASDVDLSDFYTESETDAAIAAYAQPLDAQLTEWAGVDPSENGKSLVSAANYAAMHALLDLEIGTDVQAWDANLDQIAALTPTKGNLVVGNGSAWVAVGVGTDGQVLKANSAVAAGVAWADISE